MLRGRINSCYKLLVAGSSLRESKLSYIIVSWALVKQSMTYYDVGRLCTYLCCTPSLDSHKGVKSKRRGEIRSALLGWNKGSSSCASSRCNRWVHSGTGAACLICLRGELACLLSAYNFVFSFKFFPLILNLRKAASKKVTSAKRLANIYRDRIMRKPQELDLIRCRAIGPHNRVRN